MGEQERERDSLRISRGQVQDGEIVNPEVWMEGGGPDGTRLTLYRSGVARQLITLEVAYPDGTRRVETIRATMLATEWAVQITDDHG